MIRGDALHVLQIGANDGVYVDPLHSLLLRYKSISGTRVEPVLEYFSRLERNCSIPELRSRVRCVRAAICAHDGTVDMLLPNPVNSLGTFRQGIAHLRQADLYHYTDKEEWLEEKVPAMSPESLLMHSISPIADIYISDCEGYDLELAALMPFSKMRTRLIYIEVQSNEIDSGPCKERLGSQLAGLWSLLATQGFNQVVWDGFNLIAWKSRPAAFSRYPSLVQGE